MPLPKRRHSTHARSEASHALQARRSHALDLSPVPRAEGSPPRLSTLRVLQGTRGRLDRRRLGAALRCPRRRRVIRSMKIAVDAMGGDGGVPVSVEGAIAAAREYGLDVVLVGDQATVERELARHRVGSLPITVRHASQVVEMGEQPSHALRRKRDSSMRVAASLVRDGEAAAFISAGQHGRGDGHRDVHAGRAARRRPPGHRGRAPQQARPDDPARRRRQRRSEALAPRPVRRHGPRLRPGHPRRGGAARGPPVRRRGGGQGQRVRARGLQADRGLADQLRRERRGPRRLQRQRRRGGHGRVHRQRVPQGLREPRGHADPLPAGGDDPLARRPSWPRCSSVRPSAGSGSGSTTRRRAARRSSASTARASSATGPRRRGP